MGHDSTEFVEVRSGTGGFHAETQRCRGRREVTDFGKRAGEGEGVRAGKSGERDAATRGRGEGKWKSGGNSLREASLRLSGVGVRDRLRDGRGVSGRAPLKKRHGLLWGGDGFREGRGRLIPDPSRRPTTAGHRHGDSVRGPEGEGNHANVVILFDLAFAAC